jgi:hypothetical protein
MTKKKHDEERDEHNEGHEAERHEGDKEREGVLFHGLPEPSDEIHRELREQDRIREQQIEAQAPVNRQEGVTPSGNPFPFSASINEPQTVSLPIPEDIDVPKPSISSINPIEATIGDDDFTLYVTGENFFKDSVLNFAGQNEPTTLNEDGTLSTGVNMALWQGPDTVPVVIKNGPEVSDPVDFTFNAPSSRSKKKRDE